MKNAKLLNTSIQKQVDLMTTGLHQIGAKKKKQNNTCIDTPISCDIGKGVIIKIY